MRIFVSHRWNDGNTFADGARTRLRTCCGWLCTALGLGWLRARLGLAWVHVDYEARGVGAIPKEICDRVAKCDVMVVVIGKTWLADPRLTADEDWVRYEVHEAIAQRKLIVPVLVDDASGPTKADLELLDEAHKRAAETCDPPKPYMPIARGDGQAGRRPLQAWKYSVVRPDKPDDWNAIARDICRSRLCLGVPSVIAALATLILFLIAPDTWKLSATLPVDYVVLEAAQRTLRPLPDPQQVASIEAQVVEVIMRPCGSGECRWKPIDPNAAVVVRPKADGSSTLTALHPLRPEPGRATPCELRVSALSSVPSAVRMSAACETDVEITATGALELEGVRFVGSEGEALQANDGAEKTVFLVLPPRGWLDVTYKRSAQRVWDTELPVSALTARLTGDVELPGSRCKARSRESLRIAGELRVTSLDLAAGTLRAGVSSSDWTAYVRDENNTLDSCQATLGAIGTLPSWKLVGGAAGLGLVLLWLADLFFLRARAVRRHLV